MQSQSKNKAFLRTSILTIDRPTTVQKCQKVYEMKYNDWQISVNPQFTYLTPDSCLVEHNSNILSGIDAQENPF